MNIKQIYFKIFSFFTLFYLYKIRIKIIVFKFMKY